MGGARRSYGLWLAHVLALSATHCLAQAPGSTGQAEDPPQARFSRAGAAYEAGSFADAARLYESLLSEGYDDARIFYNLGNCWFKQGRLGPANLAYERALERNPLDADAKENLAYANLLIVDKVGTVEEDFPATLLDVFERRMGADRAAGALAALALAAGLVAMPLWFEPGPSLRRLLRTCLGFLLPLAVLAALATAIAIARPGHAEYAVVLADSADARSAPASDGTVLFTVHEGLKVEVRGERSGWFQIGLPNGLTGWIEAPRAERI